MSGSYGINDWVGSMRGVIKQNTLDRKDKFWGSPTESGASRTPLFLDSMWLGGFVYDEVAPSDEEGFAPSSIARYAVNRHSGEVNAVFVGCSVGDIGIKELWTLKWSKDFRTGHIWTLSGGVTPDKWPQWMRGFKDF